MWLSSRGTDFTRWSDGYRLALAAFCEPLRADPYPISRRHPAGLARTGAANVFGGSRHPLSRVPGGRPALERPSKCTDAKGRDGQRPKPEAGIYVGSRCAAPRCLAHLWLEKRGFECVYYGKQKRFRPFFLDRNRLPIYALEFGRRRRGRAVRQRRALLFALCSRAGSHHPRKRQGQNPWAA